MDVTFDLVSNMKAAILVEGYTVGYMERTIGGYELFLNYEYIGFVPEKRKAVIKPLVEKIWYYRDYYIRLSRSTDHNATPQWLIDQHEKGTRRKLNIIE